MAFATAEDVSERLGRELTDTETQRAESTIAAVTSLIAIEVDRDDEWAEALDPVPEALTALCVEKAILTVSNPAPGVVASESLGAHSVTYAREGGAADGLFLSDTEKRLARLIVYGANAASSSPRSVVDRIQDLRENRDVDEPVTD